MIEIIFKNMYSKFKLLRLCVGPLLAIITRLYLVCLFICLNLTYCILKSMYLLVEEKKKSSSFKYFKFFIKLEHYNLSKNVLIHTSTYE